MHDQGIFLLGPLFFLGEVRSEFVEPTFAALLVDAIGQSQADLLPVLGPM